MWPIGPWPKDPHLKELGRWGERNWADGMEGWVMALFTRMLGVSEDFCHSHLMLNIWHPHLAEPILTEWGSDGTLYLYFRLFTFSLSISPTACAGYFHPYLPSPLYPFQLMFPHTSNISHPVPSPILYTTPLPYLILTSTHFPSQPLASHPKHKLTNPSGPTPKSKPSSRK